MQERELLRRNPRKTINGSYEALMVPGCSHVIDLTMKTLVFGLLIIVAMVSGGSQFENGKPYKGKSILSTRIPNPHNSIPGPLR